MDTNVTELGGFEEAAVRLSRLSERTYSRQGVHQLWKRRDVNGFPDRRPWDINGRRKLLFNLEDVDTWYAFPEAAVLLTGLSGKHYNSADVWLLWTLRWKTGFPEMENVHGRMVFPPARVGKWYEQARSGISVDGTREHAVS